MSPFVRPLVFLFSVLSFFVRLPFRVVAFSSALLSFIVTLGVLLLIALVAYNL